LNIQPVRFVAARHYSLWTRLPFFLAGGLKIAYDLILYKEFVSHRPPEEALQGSFLLDPSPTKSRNLLSGP
jgi:hypothetical protein